MKNRLGEVRHAGATLHLVPGAALPQALLVEIVRARVTQNDERAATQGVPRNSSEHRAVALDAAARARTVLELFERQYPGDLRPRRAIEAIEAWARGARALSMDEVRRLSLSAHAAARGAASESARSAARAAGHAIATWHVPRHAEGAFSYAAKARSAAGESRRTS
jgi:hypothetical protein